jgi:hypothetical protein
VKANKDLLPDFLVRVTAEGADVPAALADIPADDLAAIDAEIVGRFEHLSEEPITSQTIEEMEALADARDMVRGETDRRDSAAAEAARRVQELARRITGQQPDQPGDGDDDGTEQPPAPGDQNEDDEDLPEDATPPPPTRALVPAAADSVSLSAVRQHTAPARLPAASRARGRVKIHAAADLPGIPTGARIDFDKLVAATESRFRGFPSGEGRPGMQLKASIASIECPYDADVTQSPNADDDSALIARAVDQTRLPGNSLVAAGGWCAPSETVYDLCEPETTSGMVSVPEMQVRRGGLRFPVSPLFSDIYTNTGFIQTEAQNIAGTPKPCYEIGCPSFTEVRLDAVGLCITAGILQQRGYPEMVARVLRGAMTAHAHRVNKYVIDKMVSLSTAVTAPVIGFGAWADTLSALELQVVDIRYKYRLGDNSAVEAVAPAWLKPIMRADLAVRNGSDPNSSTSDAQLTAHFRDRNVNIQWVLDWQDSYAGGGTLGGATAATAWPTTAQILIYPAGTFVKGTADVIELSGIYDSVNIRTNSYTALFTEQGLLIAKRCMEGRVITLDELCPSGRTGEQVAYAC